MANRFLSNIKINDEYTLPSADGTADQIITTDGAGQLSFVDQGTIAAESAEVVEVPVKNVHTATILKGTPVYIFGSVGTSGRLEVKPADAGVAGSMPALGLLKQDLAVNGEGSCVITGKLRNLITSPIDGVTTNDGDVVYVKAGGGLTTTKPTGSANLIQNMGKVGRSSTSNNGTFVVSSILRSNDVPNLTTGKIWVGDGNTTESTVVHLDETNGRMGIGTTSPDAKLHVQNYTTGESHQAMFKGGALTIGDYSYISLSNGYAGEYNKEVRLAAVAELGTSNKTGFAVLTSPDASGASGHERLRITADGDVGIGTTAPDSKLEVASTDSNTYVHVRNDSTGSTRLKMSNLSDTNSNGFQIINNGSNGQVNLLNYKASTLALWTNSSQRMTILSTGKVGIGTTSPTRKLEVFETDTSQSVNVGAFEFRAVSNHGSSSNLFYHRQDNNSIVINEDAKDVDFRIEGVSQPSLFSVYAGNNLVAIRSSGKILELQDSSSTGNPYLSFAQQGNRKSLIQHVDGGDMLSLVSEYGGIRMMTGTGGAEVSRFDINSAGRVMLAREGITGSMTASIYDFNITGNNFNDKYLNFWSQDGTNNPRAWLKHSSSASTQELEFNSVFSTGSGYADFAFRRGATPIMFLDQSTQKVGIGTETPSSKLQVDGGVQVANDSDAASASKVGTLRYRTSGNNSYVDMCMQTAASTYEWVNIVQNNW